MNPINPTQFSSGSAGSGPIPKTVSVTESEVISQVMRARSNLDQVDLLLSNLIDRLYPVLRQGDGGQPPEFQPDIMCPLANDISVIAHRVDVTAKRIDAILKHLAV